MWTSRETHLKRDVMVVRGDELLLISLFLKVDTTLKAAIILFLLPFTSFFDLPLMGSILHYIISYSDTLKILVNR